MQLFLKQIASNLGQKSSLAPHWKRCLPRGTVEADGSGFCDEVFFFFPQSRVSSYGTIGRWFGETITKVLAVFVRAVRIGGGALLQCDAPPHTPMSISHLGILSKCTVYLARSAIAPPPSLCDSRFPRETSSWFLTSQANADGIPISEVLMRSSEGVQWRSRWWKA